MKTRSSNEAVRHTPILHLKQVLAYFGPDKTIQSITLPQVGKFYRSDILLKLPNGQYRADQTIRKTARVFRMLILWLQEQGIIEIAPLPKQIPHLLPEATISPDKQPDTPLSDSL